MTHLNSSDASSNDAVPVVVVVWLVNASPVRQSNVRLTPIVPICVHVTKSLDTNDVNVLPERVRRTHRGAVPGSDIDVALVPPVAERHCITTPLPGVTITVTCFAFASSESRNITPAFVHTFVLLTLLTRAVSVTLPLNVVWMYWKSSAVSQMSRPRLLMENVTPSVDADPLPGPI